MYGLYDPFLFLPKVIGTVGKGIAEYPISGCGIIKGRRRCHAAVHPRALINDLYFFTGMYKPPVLGPSPEEVLFFPQTQSLDSLLFCHHKGLGFLHQDFSLFLHLHPGCFFFKNNGHTSAGHLYGLLCLPDPGLRLCICLAAVGILLDPCFMLLLPGPGIAGKAPFKIGIIPENIFFQKGKFPFQLVSKGQVHHVPAILP